jgi:FkbM family methyltransferase
MINLESYLNTPLACEKSLRRYFSSKDVLTIFDIGACEGEDSIRYARLFPNSRIFSFEPVPGNFQKMSDNLKNFNVRSVSCFREAMSDKEGEAVFYVSSGHPDTMEKNKDWDYGNKSSSLLLPDKLKDTHAWLKFEKQINVKTNTIKNFCLENNIHEIDYIHMDVQGAELKVLQGAGEFIDTIKSVWLEVETVSLYENQPLKEDVEQFFKKHGFIKHMDTAEVISGDQLYLNKKYFNASVKLKRFLQNVFKKEK